MNVADIRDAVKAVVEAHATWFNFYSIWSPAKDRPSELTYPCAVWGPWRSRLVEDEAGAVERLVTCTLVVVDAVATDRDSDDRDQTAEAAEQTAAEFILKLRQDYGRFLDISNVQTSTLHDEGTVLETGVVLTFTVKALGPVCLDGEEFNPPSDCPPSCPVDVVVNVDGVEVGTLTNLDPCEAQTININISW